VRGTEEEVSLRDMAEIPWQRSLETAFDVIDGRLESGFIVCGLGQSFGHLWERWGTKTADI